MWKTLLNLESATQQALAMEADGESKVTLFEDFEPNPGGQTHFLELTRWKSIEPLSARWFGAIGGIGCIAGETKINGIPVRELTRSPIKVQTLMGEAWATPAFMKGQANLYRVTLRSGKRVLVTEQHRFLSPSGWHQLRSLGCGALVACHDIGNDSQNLGKSKDSPKHYQGHFLNGDELPHPALVAALEQFELLSWLRNGIPCEPFRHSIANSCQTSENQLSAFEHLFSQAFYGLPRYQRQKQQQFLDRFHLFRNGQLSRPLEDNNYFSSDIFHDQDLPQILCKLWQQIFCLSQKLEQYKHSFWSVDNAQKPLDNLFFLFEVLGLVHEVRAFAMLSKQNCAGLPRLWQLSECLNVHLKVFAKFFLRTANVNSLFWANLISGNTSNSNSYWDIIEAIEYVRYDDFYDLHIPIANHYLAEGIWHHNSGKSYSGAIWACSRALLAPDARGMISANSYGQLARATLLALVEVCRTFNIPLEPWRESPEDQALAIANCQRCYIGPDRAFVYVLSATAFTGSTQAGRGLQIRWVWGDEFAYAAEKAFLTIDGRLGRGPGNLKGQGILTTSPAGYNYLWDKFGDPTRSDDLKRIYQMVSMSSLENRKHLGDDYVASLEANYSDELYQQEINGQFINTVQGLIYKYFSRQDHCLNDEDAQLLEYDPNLPLLLTFDFNYNPAVAIAAQRRGSEIHFCQEWFLMDSDIWELAEQIVNWVEDWGIPPEIQIFGDATGRARSAASRLSSWDIVFQGLEPLAKQRGRGYLIRKFADSNPYVVNRIHSVNQLFRQSRCFVHFANCQNLVKDFEQVTWNEESINKVDNPLLSHLSDAAGYLIHGIYPFKKEARNRNSGKRKTRGVAA